MTGSVIGSPSNWVVSTGTASAIPASTIPRFPLLTDPTSPVAHANAAVLHQQTARSPAPSVSLPSSADHAWTSAQPGTPSRRAAIASSRSCSASCRQFVLHPRYAALTDAISVIQRRRSLIGVFRPRAHIWPVHRGQSVAFNSGSDSSLRASDLLADDPHLTLGRSKVFK